MRTLLALVLLMLPTLVHAQGSERIVVLEAGIVSGKPGKLVPAPGTATGFTREIDDFKLMKRTDTIVAKQGVRFGMRFRVERTPPGKLIKARCITRFPADGVTNPKGMKVQVDEYDCDLRLGDVTWRSYTFDDSWEMVPGDWTLEFWLEGRKIGEKRFTIVKP